MAARAAWRFWVAFGALAVAIALLAPSLAPLSGSMDAFAQDLANGTFRPFGQLGGGRGALINYGSTLGGFTGASPGNYLPGAGDVPQAWTMDRDGRGGVVTIDSVFDPDLGAMKRLKAYDKVADDGETLGVGDSRLQPTFDDPTLRYDRIIRGSFAVEFHPNAPIPIFSPHPKARLSAYSLDPPLSGGVQFFRDGADTLYALGHVNATSTLNITFVVSSDYYSLPRVSDVRTSDYAYSASVPRPVVPPQLANDAKLVLARAGVKDATDVGGTLDALSTYFRSFTEGDIPPPTEVESLYLALALGGHGCCRHRAFAFMVTAQSVGIPTRVVVNEAHAFVEVALPDGHWHQINLGGCGAYVLNNPNRYPSLFDQATNPRSEANPDESSTIVRTPTSTTIVDAPATIVKGDAFVVNGTVIDRNLRGVPGARVDLYLNETKTTPGRLAGTGAADASGRFSIVANVPNDAPARGYQLVARGSDGHVTTTRYQDSWSDPTVDVFAPTQFAFAKAAGAVGATSNVSGRLFDAGGTGVDGAVITWSVGDNASAQARTDAQGRFAARVTPTSVGGLPLHFRYDGDTHHGPARADITMNVSTAAILPAEDVPVLVRGQRNVLQGDLAAAGATLAGRSVTATLVGAGGEAGEGATGPDGHFAIAITLRAGDALGNVRVAYAAPDLGLTADSLARVAAAATLAVDAPSSVAPGDAWVVTATLTGDNGTRIEGGIVQVTFDGNASTTLALLTNRTGVARFELAPGFLDQGGHSLLVAFLGDADHVASSATRSVSIAKPWYADLPPWLSWLLLALLVLVAALAPALKRDSRTRAWLRAHVAGRFARPQRRFLAVAFPDHPPGVAPVFEPARDRAARVRVVVRDGDGRAAPRTRVALLAGDGTRVRGVAMGEEGATLDVPVPASPGELAIRAHALGIDRLWTRPVELRVPVRSYRAAVESGFVALRRRAGLPDAITPGELVDRLAPRLAPPVRASLERAASLFEVADYSEARVDRAFYHAFARAASDVHDSVEEASG